MAEITLYPAASGDDGLVIDVTGSPSFDNSAAWFTVGNSGAAGTERYSFIRFPNVAIPQGSVITSAVLTLYARDGLSDTVVSGPIYGNKSFNAIAPTTSSAYLALAKTSASVTWTIPATTANSAYSPNDLASIIQEIVYQGSWTSGNALMLMLEQTGISGKYRTFWSYDGGNAAYYPKLVINYVTTTSLISATINLASSIHLSGSIMSGEVGDTRATLSIPLSMSGTIQNTPRSFLNGTIAIPLVISGTIFAPQYYEGMATLEFPPFTLSAIGSIGCFGVSNISFPAFDLSATGITDVLGNGAVNFSAFDISATGIVNSLGTASLTFKSFTLSGIGWTAVTGIANISFPSFTLEADNIVIGSIGVFDKEFPAFTLSSTTLLSINGSASILFPAFSLDTATLPLTATYLSMVLNLKNRALTLYDNYDFNSMCRFNGKHFGATSTNIYDLGLGDTDSGTLISWNLRTGYLDLEQKFKKKLRQAWLSYKSDGNIILTIIQPDGQEFEYTLDGIYDDETGLRAKFGKGLRSKYVALDIQNVDGSTLTLDSIKLILDQYTGKR